MDFVYIPRFGESLRIAQDNLDCKNFYAFNPGFDKQKQSPSKHSRRMSIR